MGAAAVAGAAGVAVAAEAGAAGAGELAAAGAESAATVVDGAGTEAGNMISQMEGMAVSERPNNTLAC